MTTLDPTQPEAVKPSGDDARAVFITAAELRELEADSVLSVGDIWRAEQ